MGTDAMHAKKIVAAISAVMQHLAEEAACVASSMPAPAPALPAAPPVWAHAGRQDAMLFRALWQRRLSKTW